jgi:hypothetical protein
MIVLQTTSENLFAGMLPWMGLLTVIVIAGGAIALWIRRRIKSNDSSASSGYTLSDLRKMRASGQIDETEYKMARKAIIDVFKGGEESASSSGNHTQTEFSENSSDLDQEEDHLSS